MPAALAGHLPAFVCVSAAAALPSEVLSHACLSSLGLFISSPSTISVLTHPTLSPTLRVLCKSVSKLSEPNGGCVSNPNKNCKWKGLWRGLCMHMDHNKQCYNRIFQNYHIAPKSYTVTTPIRPFARQLLVQPWIDTILIIDPHSHDNCSKVNYGTLPFKNSCLHFPP